MDGEARSVLDNHNGPNDLRKLVKSDQPRRNRPRNLDEHYLEGSSSTHFESEQNGSLLPPAEGLK